MVTWSTFYTGDSQFWTDLFLTSVWSYLLFPCEQVYIFLCVTCWLSSKYTMPAYNVYLPGPPGVQALCVPLSFTFRPQVIQVAFNRLWYPLLLVISSISNFYYPIFLYAQPRIYVQLRSWRSGHKSKWCKTKKKKCMHVGFKTLFYVVRYLDSTASYLPTGLHIGFVRSWPYLYLPSSFSSVFPPQIRG